MPRIIGRQILEDAIHEINNVDPRQPIDAADVEFARRKATDLLESWALDRRFIHGLTISTYNLIPGGGTYTIGPGGLLDQVYPEGIERWSAFSGPPNADGTIPGEVQEIPRGVLATPLRWQNIRDKGRTTTSPIEIAYFDHEYEIDSDDPTAGQGAISVWPIPSTLQAIRLYQWVQKSGLESIDPDVEYVFPKGYSRAIVKNLALELAPTYGADVVITDLLIRQAEAALEMVQRQNDDNQDVPLARDFLIGTFPFAGFGPGRFNIERGS